MLALQKQNIPEFVTINGILMPCYQGYLDFSRIPDKLQRRAFTSWMNQRQRCYYKKDRQYKYYGAIGITTNYGTGPMACRKFMSWWLYEYKINGPFKDPTINRLDHSKAYQFDNIELMERSENTIECNNRTKTIRQIQIFRNGKPSKIVNTLVSAEEFTGVHHSNVSRYCRGILKTNKNGWSFKFVSA